MKSHPSPGFGLVLKVPVGKDSGRHRGRPLHPVGDTTAAHVNQEVEKTDGDEAELG